MDDIKSTLNRAEMNCTQNLRKSPRNGKYERKIKSLVNTMKRSKVHLIWFYEEDITE